MSVILAVCSLLTGYDEPASQAISISHDVGPLRVRVQAEKKQWSLSDKVLLRIAVTAPEKTAVEGPAIKEGEEWGSAQVLEIHVEGPDAIPGPFGTLLVQTWLITLEPMALGALQPPPLGVRWREPGAEPKRGSIPMPRLEILPGPTSSSDPATLRPVPPLPTDAASLLPKFLRWAGIGLLVVVAAAWLLYGRRGESEPRPAQVGLAALKSLESNPPAENRALVDRCSEIVRQYVTQAYALSAEQQTTQEFLRDERTQAALMTHQRTALKEFLQTTDAVRFPAEGPDADSAALCLRRGRAFLAGEA
jgi:hypothetical protein